MSEILSDRSIIELNGEQSLSFLQNLVTNDLFKNKYCYAYLLSNQGRYLFDFFVYSIDNLVLIDIDKDSAQSLIAKLNFYKLRTKIEIKINEDYKVLYSHTKIENDVIYSYKDPRSLNLGFRSLINNRLSLVDPEEYNQYLNDKYDYTIPDGCTDLIYDKSIPVEYGAEELNSIDYNKGCYVGQEVISRTKYQGVIRKKIYKVIAEGPLSSNSLQAEILSDAIKLGVCCSSYKNLGIALIREERLNTIQNDSITIENIPVKLIIPQWRQT